jgi:hypothetical protein
MAAMRLSTANGGIVLEIFYTGTLVTPDGSDSFDGEPCEEGHGATVESGWLDPDWSLGEVRESRDDVRPDKWHPVDGPMVEWIVGQLSHRLNGVEVEGAGERGTFYAVDETGPYDMHYTGVSLRMAAHVEGASVEVLRAVCEALRAAR